MSYFLLLRPEEQIRQPGTTEQLIQRSNEATRRGDLIAHFLGFNSVQSILSMPHLASAVKLIPQATLIYLTAAVASLLRERKYNHGVS